MGPVVLAAQLERIQRYVQIGRDEGAELALGGERHGERGYFHQPTIFTSVRNDMRIAQEEIFGPVMSVMKFSSEDEAYRIANDVEYGLAAGVWTNDLNVANRASRALRVGTVLDQHLPDGLPVGVLRRRQAVRPRPQSRRGFARRLHPAQERLDEGQLTLGNRNETQDSRMTHATTDVNADTTLQAIQDRIEITDVLYRYASTIDSFDLEGLRRTLADDLVAQYGNADPVIGRRRRGGLDRGGDRTGDLAAPLPHRLPR